MNYSKKCVTALPVTVIVSLTVACFFASTAAADKSSSGETDLATYLLGPQDQLAIRVIDMDETPSSTPLRIDPNGNIDLPLIGPVHAAGLTISQLRAELVDKYKKYVIAPVVTVAVLEFHSQPVTVVGSVHTPG
ncbi:MAG: polysaccharide biosynthesis/export family protein, partial [Acidobacteria bacterium]|nr:polysaccharide biosynthesis/export family protein [Acidobacteriota bacterium]